MKSTNLGLKNVKCVLFRIIFSGILVLLETNLTTLRMTLISHDQTGFLCFLLGSTWIFTLINAFRFRT